MKIPVILSLLVTLLLSGPFSRHATAETLPSFRPWHDFTARDLASEVRQPHVTGVRPLQTGGPPLPDPVTLLQNTVAAYQAVRSAHYEVTDRQTTGVFQVLLSLKGNATCNGPAFTANAAGSAGQIGTTPSKTLKASYIVIKSTAWQKSASTHNKWKKVNLKKVNLLGLNLADQNPLLCNASSSSGGSSGSGSGSSSPPPQDIVNLGAETFGTVPVWHVHFIITSTSNSGQPINISYDILLSQVGFLPYQITVHVDDTANNTTLDQVQMLTNFNKPVKIKNPLPTKKSKKK